ncbi:MAG: NUDIX hydrolase [Arcanobacterium sp.]|nr:NUDIX hydrolase [Arcanobacterium sp.]
MNEKKQNFPEADVYAAGCVLWRWSDALPGEIEVLLVHRPHWNDWSYPKGKQERGEELCVTAVRETAEETGYLVALGQSLGWQEYRIANRKRKAVHYWLAQVTAPAKSTKSSFGRVRRAPVTEIDELRWVNLATAAELLTQKTDLKLLHAVSNLAAQERIATRALIVLRHSEALKREKWCERKGVVRSELSKAECAQLEETRPLTRKGRNRAQDLIPELAAYGVQRIYSSPWSRCADTIRPFAKSFHEIIRQRIELTEHAIADDMRPAQGFFEKAIERCAMKSTRVVCVHRPSLPMIFKTLEPFFVESEISQALPQSSPWIKPGDYIVFHVSTQQQEPKIIGLEIVNRMFT